MSTILSSACGVQSPQPKALTAQLESIKAELQILKGIRGELYGILYKFKIPEPAKQCSDEPGRPNQQIVLDDLNRINLDLHVENLFLYDIINQFNELV